MALQYVGGKSVTGNSGTLTLTLNAGLTGGIGSAVQAGDLVIVSYSAVSTANLSITLGDGTWDSPTGLWANDTRDANLRVASKIMGGTPDTQVQGSGNTTATNGATMTCQVWRGADPITPQDVAMQTATAINSAVPNPPSVTPVTAGAVIVAIGCGSGAATNPAVTAPTGYSNLVQATVDPGNSITSAMASKAWSGSGAEDPGAFGGITTSTSDGWCAATFVIRPLVVTAPTVTTQAVSAIGTTTATGNGNITATGNENADARGIVYSTTSHGAPGNVAPGSSGYESVNNETGSFGTGAFARSLAGLTSNQTYYARAYAHNSAGYSYGAEVSFTTVATFNDRRQAIIDHIVSAQSEANGWNAKRPSIPVTAVVRTSSTVVTITLPAIASYDVTSDEHLTVTVPGEALTGGSDIVGDQTVDITAGAGAQTGNATAASTTWGTGTATPSPGGRTISATAGATTWAAGIATAAPGPRTASATAAVTTWTGVTPTIRIAMQATAASSVWSGGTSSAIPGARTVSATAATTSWSGGVATGVPGARTIIATAGATIWSGGTATGASGPVTKAATAATGTWSGGSASVSGGGVAPASAAATLWTGNTVTVTTGPVTKPATAGVTTWSVGAASAIATITVSATAASTAWVGGAAVAVPGARLVAATAAATVWSGSTVSAAAGGVTKPATSASSVWSGGVASGQPGPIFPAATAATTTWTGGIVSAGGGPVTKPATASATVWAGGSAIAFGPGVASASAATTIWTGGTAIAVPGGIVRAATAAATVWTAAIALAAAGNVNAPALAAATVWTANAVGFSTVVTSTATGAETVWTANDATGFGIVLEPDTLNVTVFFRTNTVSAIDFRNELDTTATFRRIVNTSVER